jgi:magnesium transporter
MTTTTSNGGHARNHRDHLAAAGPDASRELRWSVAVAPTQGDLEHFEGAGFSREELADVLDPHERPRIRLNGADTKLVVLRVASVGKAPPLSTLPLGILLGAEQGLITCPKDVELVRRLRAALDGERATIHRALPLVLELVANAYLEQLARIEEAVEKIESRLERSLANKDVLVLLRHQKSLMHFNVALDEMLVALEHLQKELCPSADNVTWLEDALVELRQARVVAELSSRDLGQMMTAFSSIISNDLNVVMKFLASVTVVLTWPLFLASLYGMNVPLPFQHSPAAAGIVVALAVGGCSLLFFLLRRRRWL